MIRDLIRRRLGEKGIGELLTGAGLFLGFKVLGIVAGVLFTYLVSNDYGAHALGLLALGTASLQITSMVCRIGTDAALIRLVGESMARSAGGRIRKIYLLTIKLVLLASGVGAVALFLGADFMATRWFDDADLAAVFRVFAVLVPLFGTLIINTEFLRALKRLAAYGFLQISAPYLFATFFLVAVAPRWPGGMAPVYAYSAAILTVAALSVLPWARQWRRLDRREDGEPFGMSVLLPIALPMLVTNSCGLLLGWTDTVLLGVFTTERDVGIYNVALKIAAALSIGLMAINSIAAPRFAECYGRRDWKELNGIVHQSSWVILVTTVPIAVVILLFSEQALGWFGTDFPQGRLALTFLAIGHLANALAGSVGYLMNMIGEHVAFQRFVLIGAGVNVVLNLALIPFFGMEGAAVATMIGMVLFNGLSVWYVKRKFDILTIWTPSRIFNARPL